MSDYTQKNLQDVENVGADRAPGFEARFARNHIDSDHLGVSFFRYPPSFKTPFGHHHREQEEAYVVVEGSGRMRLGDEIIELRQWDVVRVAPQVVRSFESGPEGMAYLAIGNDRPEGGDGVLVEDFWAD
jgi:mannose-6-phosphate isomerase-like protein (cupin superfamily)